MKIKTLSRLMYMTLTGIFVASLTGCMTMPDQRARTAVQEREDILLVREDMRRLSGRIEGLELEIERLHRDLAAVRTDQQRTVQTQVQGMETRTSALERRIQEVDTARENDKKAIVDQLSKTIEQLMRSQQQAARTTTQRAPRQSGYGYEHTVGPGETLSHIATAYGVTTRVIIDANNLQNPDRLQVGQKIFIPE